MIPGITENFGFESRFATLHEATISLEEMGERTISTQVRIEPGLSPSYNDWYLVFNGEKFVLNSAAPQAEKSNSTVNTLASLTFESYPVFQMKRYFFAEMTQVSAGTYMASKYEASLNLSLANFVIAFNRVLSYYFDTQIVMSIDPLATIPTDVREMDINYMYIWDVLKKIYDVYGVSWHIEHNSTTDVYTIVVGGEPTVISHVFEYGYNGGLKRIERQAQDLDIYNQLLGRGGQKNIPYRYFKITDPNNTEWAADPDAIPELKNVTFDRLMDYNFRLYVQGWMTNPHRTIESGYPTATYDPSLAAQEWAYEKGHTDATFDPVEYVKDDDSIAIYGVRHGKLDDNDDIYPTIQGLEVSPYGRIDETVAIGEITDGDDGEQVVNGPFSLNNIILQHREDTGSGIAIQGTQQFTVSNGFAAFLTFTWHLETMAGYREVEINTNDSKIVAKRVSDGAVFNLSNIPEGGPYVLSGRIYLYGPYDTKMTEEVGIKDISYTESYPTYDSGYTFNIWIKNIWDSTQGANESDVEYMKRIWEPILGDRLGNAAKIVFSDGWMSTSQDYEFTIVRWPELDRSKSLDGVASEWMLTLKKSDAEYDSTGLYIPNTQSVQPQAGDHFFFTGIDMPHIYVTEAEKKLRAIKTEDLSEKAWSNPTWGLDLDKVRINTLEGQEQNTLASTLDVGKAMQIKDKRLTNNQTLTFGIRSISYTWNEPSDGNPYLYPDVQVTLSERALSKTGSIEKLSSQVKYVVSKSFVTTEEVEKTVNRVRQQQQSQIPSEGSTSLDAVWESLSNNTDKPNETINTAHIPDLFTQFINGIGRDANKVVITVGRIQRKLTVGYASNAAQLNDHSSYFLAGGEGESVTVDTETYTEAGVMQAAWGAEGDTEVNLIIGQTSKTLLKPAALTSITSRITTLEGYFTSGKANNALQLNGHADTYFATASALSALDSAAVKSISLNSQSYTPTSGVITLPAYPTTLPASDVYAWAKASTKPSYAFSEITGTVAASQLPKASASTLGGIKVGSNLSIASDGTLSALDSGVTSVGLSMPTGFSVSNSPVTSTGTLTVAFASGYSLPTTTKQGQWDTAYTNNHTHSNKSVLDGISSTDVSHWGTAYTNSHTHSNKTILDGITEDDISHWGTAYTNNHTHSNKTYLDGINGAIGAAAYYGIGSVEQDDEGLVTGGDVWAAIEALPEPMVFKGSLGTGGTITTLPTASFNNEGWTYKVITDGTYAGQSAKVGDTFISTGIAWVIIPSGDEPSGTVTSVGLTVPTGLSVSGSPITSSGTLVISFTNGYSIPTTENQTAWSAKYDKPSGGIPSDDMTSAVQASLLAADTALQFSDMPEHAMTSDTSTAGQALVSKAGVGSSIVYEWKSLGSFAYKSSILTTDLPTGTVVDSSYVHTDNNFTDTLLTKLNGIAQGAEVNVQSDWNATSGDALIKNKPTTIAGYGITDAKIDNGVITLGQNTITPLTSHQTLTNHAKVADTSTAGQVLVSKSGGYEWKKFGTLAGKDSLAASDIPDISGTYALRNGSVSEDFSVDDITIDGGIINYTSSTRLTLPTTAGTIALTSDIPSTLPNPHALKWSDGTNNYSYNGGGNADVTITAASLGAAAKGGSVDQNFSVNNLTVEGYLENNVTSAVLNLPDSSGTLVIGGTTLAHYGITDATITTGSTADKKKVTLGSTEQEFLISHQTVTLASGTNNGTLKITTAAGTTDNIAVKGLGSLAYKSSLAASDIPDISGTYALKGGNTNLDFAADDLTLDGSIINYTSSTSITLPTVAGTMALTSDITITGIKVNGTAKTPSSKVVDILYTDFPLVAKWIYEEDVTVTIDDE